ncbi:MAG: hypothetical protein GX410_01540, partial [Elusimicrobia bacterium]|nr:hypothetical protein [Elusimicrobiota bacterium]
MPKKSLEQLQDEVLAAYRNKFPEGDQSSGALLFIKSAVLSGVLWGVYENQAWILRQAFVSTAEGEYLDRHGYGRTSRLQGEDDETYRARLLEYIQQDPAGGNNFDYPIWAKEVAGVKAAYCLGGDLAPGGPGTVTVIILA